MQLFPLWVYWISREAKHFSCFWNQLRSAMRLWWVLCQANSVVISYLALIFPPLAFKQLLKLFLSMSRWLRSSWLWCIVSWIYQLVKILYQMASKEGKFTIRSQWLCFRWGRSFIIIYVPSSTSELLRGNYLQDEKMVCSMEIIGK